MDAGRRGAGRWKGRGTLSPFPLLHLVTARLKAIHSCSRRDRSPCRSTAQVLRDSVPVTSRTRAGKKATTARPEQPAVRGRARLKTGKPGARLYPSSQMKQCSGSSTNLNPLTDTKNNLRGRKLTFRITLSAAPASRPYIRSVVFVLLGTVRAALCCLPSFQSALRSLSPAPAPTLGSTGIAWMEGPGLHPRRVKTLD